MIDLQPDFTRMLKALRCKQPERVPLAELWVDRAIMEAFIGRHIGSHDTGEDYDLAAEIEFWYRAGYDYIHIEPRYFFPKKSGRQPAPDEHAGLITSWAEFHDYPWPSIDQVDFSDLERAADLLPDGMGVIAGTSGIFEESWMIMGFETLSFSLFEQPDLVAAVFQRVGSILLEIFERLVTFRRVGALWISDDLAYLSGPMLNPKVYARLLYPWYRQMKAVAIRCSLPLMLHSDGDLTMLLDDLLNIGFNALQPIEPNAMDIQALKKSIGSRVCLIGNVNLDYPLVRGKPDEVTQAVKELLRTAAAGGGYCLGSSNTIPAYVPIENYIAMIEAGRAYGKYPIAI